MAPLCSSNEGSTDRKRPGVDTRSVRRASGLLETGFQVTCCFPPGSPALGTRRRRQCHKGNL
jgi:hypothetical protein